MSVSATAPYLSAREAAEQLGVCERTVRRWIAAGQLAAVKQGRAFRIALGDLEPLRRTVSEQPTAIVQLAVPAVSRPPAAADEAAELADLARELQDELLRQTELAALYQAQATVLAEELRQLMAQPALRGRRETPGDDGWQLEPGRVDPPSPVLATLIILVIIVLSLLVIYGLGLMDLELF
jgi:excisionase family DNA binding protein